MNANPTQLLCWILCALTAPLPSSADDRYVTIILRDSADVQELDIAADQAATLTYFSMRQVQVDPLLPNLEIVVGAMRTRLWWSPDAAYESPMTTAPVIAGPCKIRVGWPYGGRAVDPPLFTFKIHTQSTPPDRTVVIPPGQGAAVSLQCSSNLTDWVTTTNGIWTNVPSMKFFRVVADRVP